MAVKILYPKCNLETEMEGGIFTWLPEEPLLELICYILMPVKSGFHYHPHFVEYLLVVDGSGTLVYGEDPNDKKRKIYTFNKGNVRTDKNTYHTDLCNN